MPFLVYFQRIFHGFKFSGASPLQDQCLAAYLSFTGFILNGVEYKKVGHSLGDILTALRKAGMSTTEGDGFALEQVKYQPEGYQELKSELVLISKKLPH